MQTGRMRLHIDTDFAGDPDDACALTMVLGWPGAEIVGITTTADPDGRRADYLCHLLSMLGRPEIPVAAGASTSLTSGDPMGALPDHERYWGMPVASRPAGGPSYTELLGRSIELGATVVAIGPYTNMALLERRRPGALSGVPVVAMGGWVSPLAEGLPDWGPERDWNVQCDTVAARELYEGTADLTVVALPAAATACLRASHLQRLRASGTTGALLAGQSVAHGVDNAHAELASRHPGLPDDLVNFHWDPVTCAVALGWRGATIREVRLGPIITDGSLRLAPDDAGRPMRLVTQVDGPAFDAVWLKAVETAQSG